MHLKQFKTAFSLLAGGLTSLAGLPIALRMPAVLSLLLSTVWFLYRRAWKHDSLDVEQA